jgi:hypothetical protein
MLVPRAEVRGVADGEVANRLPRTIARDGGGKKVIGISVLYQSERLVARIGFEPMTFRL